MRTGPAGRPWQGLAPAAEAPEGTEAVSGAGGTIKEQGELVPGEPYLFFEDPDGYEVEIWYELPTAADPPE